MLTKLLADAQQLVADLPDLQTAITAVSNDVANPAAIDPAQLATDAAALTTAVEAVEADLTALTADIGTLPQGTFQADGSLEGFAAFRDALTLSVQRLARIKNANTVGGDETLTRFQNLICVAIPYYNLFAPAGWPKIPLPAFCTPVPPPAPTP